MRQIQKYIIDSDTPIELPKNSLFLRYAEQYGNHTVWFEINAENDLETRTFKISIDGQLIPDNAIYLGSGTVNNGDTVLHLYEIEKQ